MSHASRSHALRAQRYRGQVARLIASEIPEAVTLTDQGPTGDLAPLLERATLSLLDGRGSFDVHAVREFAQGLVSLADDQAVFEDWCRSRGMGPENTTAFARRVGVWRVQIDGVEAGAWCLRGDRDASCVSTASDDAADVASRLGSAWGSRYTGDAEFSVYSESSVSIDAPERASATVTETSHFWMDRGGWPGNLARKYADAMAPCDVCVSGRVRELVDRIRVRPDMHTSRVKRAHCPKCHDARSRYAQAPMARSRARLGQRLLDMIDGVGLWAHAERQPSDCQAFGCGMLPAESGRQPRYHGGVDAEGNPTKNWTSEECPDCNGAGHNLRGALPPVEWSPAVRRNVRDAGSRTGDYDRCADWQADVSRTLGAGQQTNETVNGPSLATRSCPRCEHRKTVDSIQVRGWLARSIPKWYELPLAPGFSGPRERVPWHSRDPSWSDGEREHARQREDRQLRQTLDPAPDRTLLGLSRAVAAMPGVDWCQVDDLTTDPTMPPLTVAVRFRGSAPVADVTLVIDGYRSPGVAITLARDDPTASPRWNDPGYAPVDQA